LLGFLLEFHFNHLAFSNYFRLFNILAFLPSLIVDVSLPLPFLTVLVELQNLLQQLFLSSEISLIALLPMIAFSLAAGNFYQYLFDIFVWEGIPVARVSAAGLTSYFSS